MAGVCAIITAERLLYVLWPGRYAGAARFRPDGQLYHVASRIWYNMRSANGFAVCSRRLAAPAAKQRTAHVTPQPKPAKPVSLPLCGRQARKGLLLWYNNHKAVIIPDYGQGDTRARPAAAPMADYTMPLRGHDTIVSGDTLYERTVC